MLPKAFYKVIAILWALLLALSIAMPVRSGDDLPTLKILFFESLSETHMNEEGEIVGVTVDKVRQFLDKTGLKYQLVQLPWARLLRELSKSDHALGVNMLRTQDRENKYHWVYEIGLEEQFLISRNTPQMKEIDPSTISLGKYKGLCDVDSAQCEIFKKLGFSDDRIIRPYGSTTYQHVRMLMMGRAEFIIGNLESLQYDLAASGFKSNDLIHLLKVSTMASYLVAPKSIDSRLLEILLGVPQ